MQIAPGLNAVASPPSTNASAGPDTSDSAGGWLEVGPRQRAAITRSSGFASTSSPVNRIFGGQFRSELRIPGLKSSITLQSYQSLQLDIDEPQVRNIVDALKGITKPETIRDNFDSPHGKDVPASKQVFIESLPPVLVLHLKRFQFDREGFETVKIWKKIGYPLELEIPREVLSRQKRNALTADGSGAPKYRLTAVIYHHGKHASGGHYTVDVLRQDGREWIRLDDTKISRVRNEDVAEGGAEEDAASRAAETNKKETSATGGGSANRFAVMGGDEEAGDSDEGWNQVMAPASGGKKWSNVVNGGGATTPRGKQLKEGLKENKVAYLLFYQRV
jgi:ubiquitin carboxyl-terminal hydrolase 10